MHKIIEHAKAFMTGFYENKVKTFRCKGNLLDILDTNKYPSDQYVYMNFTLSTVKVVFADGRVMNVSPLGDYNESRLANLGFSHMDANDEHAPPKDLTKCFVILKKYGRLCDYEKTSLFTNVNGEKVNLHEVDMAVLKDTPNEHNATGSSAVLKVITHADMARSDGGVPVMELGMTIGYDTIGEEVRNKIAELHSGAPSDTNGILVKVFANKGSYGDLFMSIGHDISEVYPMADSSTRNKNMVHLYRIDPHGEPAHFYAAPVKDFLNEQIHGVKLFLNEHDAETFVNVHKQALSVNDALKAELEKSMSKCEEASIVIDEQKKKFEAAVADIKSKSEKAIDGHKRTIEDLKRVNDNTKRDFELKFQDMKRDYDNKLQDLKRLHENKMQDHERRLFETKRKYEEKLESSSFNWLTKGNSLLSGIVNAITSVFGIYRVFA